MKIFIIRIIRRHSRIKKIRNLRVITQSIRRIIITPLRVILLLSRYLLRKQDIDATIRYLN